MRTIMRIAGVPLVMLLVMCSCSASEIGVERARAIADQKIAEAGWAETFRNGHFPSEVSLSDRPDDRCSSVVMGDLYMSLVEEDNPRRATYLKNLHRDLTERSHYVVTYMIPTPPNSGPFICIFIDSRTGEYIGDIRP